jgi:hypothetical protein
MDPFNSWPWPQGRLNAELVCPHAGVPPTPLPPHPVSPALGAVHARHHTDGARDMQHQGNQANQHADHVRHSDDQGQGQHGIDRSIRPGATAPDTVLVADLCDGGLLLHGWSDGPSAYLSPSDAPALRRELTAAFGVMELARCSNPRDAL